MKTIHIVLAILWILVIGPVAAQDNVGVGTTHPDNSAQLEVSETGQDVLIPRGDGAESSQLKIENNNDADYSYLQRNRDGTFNHVTSDTAFKLARTLDYNQTGVMEHRFRVPIRTDYHSLAVTGTGAFVGTMVSGVDDNGSEIYPVDSLYIESGRYDGSGHSTIEVYGCSLP